MKKTLLISSLMLMCIMAFAQQPVITFSQTEHDFGQINEGDGRVSTIFEFKNEGMEPLVLSNVKASCGCTTPTWTKTPVEPGQTGTITVTYNPNGRPGKFQKTVTITSNASNPTTKVYIKGEVIPKPAAPANKFTNKMGELSVTAKSVNFGTVTKGSNITRQIEYANLTDHDITVDFNYDSRFLIAQLSFTTLKPNETGTLNINFDAEKCKEWGNVKSTGYFIVNGKQELTDAFAIAMQAVVEEDFSQLDAQQLAQSPIGELSLTKIDLGTIAAGSTVNAKFEVKNVGVQPLLIRKVSSNSDNVKAQAVKTTVKSGKKTEVQVTVQANNEKGEKLAAGQYNKQIEVMVNDPKAPKRKVTVSWTIE